MPTLKLTKKQIKKLRRIMRFPIGENHMGSYAAETYANGKLRNAVLKAIRKSLEKK